MKPDEEDIVPSAVSAETVNERVASYIVVAQLLCGIDIPRERVQLLPSAIDLSVSNACSTDLHGLDQGVRCSGSA